MSEEDIPRMEESTVEAVKSAPDGVYPLVGTLVMCFLLYRLVMAFRPSEEKHNPFNVPKKKAKVVKLDKVPPYLYRLARASEPSRDHYGEPVEQEGKETTVGYEATKEAGTPVKGRSLVKAYYGDPNGLDKKCIHISMADQVKSTAKLYFKGVDDLILLKFSTAAISKDEAVELRFEEAAPPPGTQARGGVFPHVYPSERGLRPRLSWWNLKACIKLPLGADGEHVFPADAFSEEVTEDDI